MQYTKDQLRVISIVQVYIHIHKNVQVNLKPQLPKEYPKLMVAFNKAREFFEQSGVEITMLDNYHENKNKNWRRYN